jgi:uncharacterized circularly permuted ATP-grasp superfamily protein
VFDEMTGDDGARPAYRGVAAWLDTLGLAAMDGKRREAETLFRRSGITFAVYGEGGDPERLIPFDLIPRVFGAEEWHRLSRGIVQRTRALNAFLWDIYHRGEILRAGVVPPALVYRNRAFRPEMIGFDPPGRIYAHVVGVDIVRTGADEFRVLEDNCRTPSGVSYMLENREIMMRMFPELFAGSRVEPVDGYADQLRVTLEEMAPRHCRRAPVCVVLTPGPFNAAYYEHSYLADQMGAELVEARDLFVDEGKLWMKTTLGPTRVDVVYRRIDDDFLDPLVFRPDSYLGVPGLMDAYRAGNVTLVSAPGAGVADDKAVYCYVPEMIRFYLGEAPLLDNVPTWQCALREHRDHVLTHLDELVVKEVHGSGGYGMLIGPRSTAAEREDFARKIAADPAAFIAQPTLDLSTVPTVTPRGIASRHVDFRPYCLAGRDIRLTPGGLTRVALAEGSLVVNSSQGGGVKDTWVLAE